MKLIRNTFVKFVLSSLAVSSMPLHCFDLASMQSCISVVERVLRDYSCRFLASAKSGADKTKGLIAAGSHRIYNSAKRGVSNVAPSKKSFKILAVTALVLGIVRFLTKKPSNEPSRFNYRKLLSREIMCQVWYLVDDLIIGRPRKSSTLKWDESGTLTVGGEYEKLGFGGYISDILKSTKGALSLVAILVALDRMKDWETISDWVGR